jgi:hypothetical protein
VEPGVIKTEKGYRECAARRSAGTRDRRSDGHFQRAAAMATALQYAGAELNTAF